MVKKCAICKKVFHVKPSHFERTKYCSRKCYGKSQQGKIFSETHRRNMSIASKGKNKDKIGNEHHRWKGGSKAYYERMANKIYREFVINPICEFCGNPNKIHIHHKDENRKNNNISNLQALCEHCHLSYHAKKSGLGLYQRRV